MGLKDLLKQIIFAIIGVIVPYLYSLLVANYPDFPLSLDQVLSVFVWVVGLLFAGWKLATTYHVFFSPHFHYRKVKSEYENFRR